MVKNKPFFDINYILSKQKCKYLIVYICREQRMVKPKAIPPKLDVLERESLSYKLVSGKCKKTDYT